MTPAGPEPALPDAARAASPLPGAMLSFRGHCRSRNLLPGFVLLTWLFVAP